MDDQTKQLSGEVAIADAAAKMWTFKSDMMRRAMCAVVAALMESDTMSLFSDEVDLSFVPDQSRNCIGMGFKMLVQTGMIRQLLIWRKHTRKGRKAAKAFKYQLVSYKLARIFLERNNHQTPLTYRDQTLALT